MVDIVVVDNGSTDGTPSAIRSHFPKVRVVETGKNLGYAKANNIGIALTTAEHLCLINSDVVVPPLGLSTMLTYMLAHRNVGLLGPKMLSPGGALGTPVLGFPTLWNSLFCAVGLHLLLKVPQSLRGLSMSTPVQDHVEDVEVLTGWFWMLSRRALDEVGGLDERFFMYGEDIDWCYRFHRAGWRVVFYPEASALHYGAASSSRAPIRYYVEMRRANMQYVRKHHGRLAACGYLFATCIHESVRMLGYGLLYCCGRYQRSETGFKIRRSAACMRHLRELAQLV
jgi:GT2 family glycosyltransferase